MARRIARIILPDGDDGLPMVDADEICFFGAVQSIPKSMNYLWTLGTPALKPEVYIVGIKSGEPLPPNVWLAPQVRERLDAASKSCMDGMIQMAKICGEDGLTQPTAVKIAVDMKTGGACTVYELNPLPAPPYSGMSRADWAFDAWITRIAKAGSALRELRDY
jgi:hypothetical protein